MQCHIIFTRSGVVFFLSLEYYALRLCSYTATDTISYATGGKKRDTSKPALLNFFHTAIARVEINHHVSKQKARKFKSSIVVKCFRKIAASENLEKKLAFYLIQN